MKFVELAWGAYLYRLNTNYDEAYCDLFKKHQDLLSNLRRDPTTVSPSEFRKSVMTFLNKWGGRHIRKDGALAEIFLRALVKLRERFQTLQGETLVEVDLHRSRQPIQEIYNSLRLISWKDSASRTVTLGETFGSKVAHVMNPSLFVMWDNEISSSAKRRGISDYLQFLSQMQNEARAAIPDFGAFNLGEDPAAFLAEKFHYEPPKTLAKLLDECNWVKSQRALDRLTPPEWLLRLASSS